MIIFPKLNSLIYLPYPAFHQTLSDVLSVFGIPQLVFFVRQFMIKSISVVLVLSSCSSSGVGNLISSRNSLFTASKNLLLAVFTKLLFIIHKMLSVGLTFVLFEKSYRLACFEFNCFIEFFLI